MTQYGVVIFHTTSGVIRAEKLLLKAGVSIKLIPTPREFSSDCGISVRFEWSNLEKIKQLLEEEQIEFDSMHLLDRKSV